MIECVIQSRLRLSRQSSHHDESSRARVSDLIAQENFSPFFAHANIKERERESHHSSPRLIHLSF